MTVYTGRDFSICAQSSTTEHYLALCISITCIILVAVCHQISAPIFMGNCCQSLTRIASCKSLSESLRSSFADVFRALISLSERRQGGRGRKGNKYIDSWCNSAERLRTTVKCLWWNCERKKEKKSIVLSFGIICSKKRNCIGPLVCTASSPAVPHHPRVH